MSIEDRFSSSARAMQFSAIRRMSALIQRPGIISFAPGQPNAETFPVARFREIADDIIAREGPAAFQYLLTRGYAPLVEAIRGYAGEKGIRATTAETLLTEGSQQGLDLIARVLVDPGDAVLVELPSYIGALSAFRAARARLTGVRLDAEGLDLDHLRARHEELRAAGVPIKFLYVIPNFQNPSGCSMTVARRRALLALAEELDLLIVEDDPYGDLDFRGGGDRPTLKQLDQGSAAGDRVVYLSSFSKILAPGLRTAFVIGPAPLLAKIEVAKQAANLCGSSLDQRIVLACLERGMIAEQRDRLRVFYRSKCDALVGGLAAEMPAGVTWTQPEGGMFVWATLPPHLDAEALLEAAVAEGVAYVAGGPFFVEDVQPNTMRLTFASATEAQIAEGVQRLARAVRAAI